MLCLSDMQYSPVYFACYNYIDVKSTFVASTSNTSKEHILFIYGLNPTIFNYYNPILTINEILIFLWQVDSAVNFNSVTFNKHYPKHNLLFNSTLVLKWLY